MKTFIIAEAGVNHNGSDDLALRLVDIAAECGADAIKFQTFSAEKLVRRGAEKAAYQKRETGEGDQFDMLKNLEMPCDLHLKLIQRCAEMKIEFMSTPFDEDAADFLISVGMKRLKVPSGEITNHSFLKFLAAKNLPIILSTGMSTLQEVEEAVEVVRKERVRLQYPEDLAQMVTVLHCTSNYPAAVMDVNLLAMNTIGMATGLPKGYSDHTTGTLVSTAAVAMGATVIEKHFTLDKNLRGPDHKASLEPDELKRMIQDIRAVEQALGSTEKKPMASELPVRDVVRRSVTSISAITKGQAIKETQVELLRPGTGIAPKELANVIGRVATRDIAAGTTLVWGDIQ